MSHTVWVRHAHRSSVSLIDPPPPPPPGADVYVYVRLSVGCETRAAADCLDHYTHVMITFDVQERKSRTHNNQCDLFPDVT